MSEIKRRPLTVDEIGDLDGGPFVVFDDNHTHSDILRYVIADVGVEHLLELVNVIAEGD